MRRLRKNSPRASFTIGALLLVFVTYQGAQTYADQKALWDSQVEECERIKTDRALNGRGWRVAQFARTVTYARDERYADLLAAERYGVIAARLEARAKIDCESEYPRPSVLPFGYLTPIRNL